MKAFTREAARKRRLSSGVRQSTFRTTPTKTMGVARMNAMALVVHFIVWLARSELTQLPRDSHSHGSVWSAPLTRAFSSILRSLLSRGMRKTLQCLLDLLAQLLVLA